MDNSITLIKNTFREISDFPIKGVSFKDITPILANKKVMQLLIKKLFCETFLFPKFDYIVGIESRGFIFASILSHILDKGLILIRKSGKLPPPVVSTSYKTEYSETSLEISISSFPKNAKVLIVDDILATGGSLKASADLIKKLNGTISGFLVIGQIDKLNGHEKLEGIAKLTTLFIF